jgi:hypothetical protein
MLNLEFFYTIFFQKFLIAFYLSLLVSRFLRHILKCCLLWRSLISVLDFWMRLFFRKFGIIKYRGTLIYTYFIHTYKYTYIQYTYILYSV